MGPGPFEDKFSQIVWSDRYLRELTPVRFHQLTITGVLKWWSTYSSRSVELPERVAIREILFPSFRRFLVLPPIEPVVIHFIEGAALGE